MNANYSLLISLILFLSCKSQQEPKAPPKKLTLENILVIEDTVSPLYLDTIDYIGTHSYHILYTGNLRDSIKLNYDLDEAAKLSIRKPLWEMDQPQRYFQPDSGDLKIIIDTSQIIGSSSHTTGYRNKRQIIKSYLVKIQNISTDTLDVAYKSHLRVYTEAKDSSGRWRPIDQNFNLYCGNGMSKTLLPPHEIILTSCKLYHGDYRTKLRVVFGDKRTCPSNEFTGTIDYNQFKRYHEVKR